MDFSFCFEFDFNLKDYVTSQLGLNYALRYFGQQVILFQVIVKFNILLGLNTLTYITNSS